MLREPRILDSGIVPEHELIQHRGSEIETLLDGLHPDRDLPPRPVAITGPPGTGKSHVAQTALQKLRDVADVRTARVSGWDVDGRKDVLRDLADALGVCTVHRSSTPFGDILDALNETPSEHRLVIIDEVDQLRSKDVCYDLHELPAITPILIANDEEGIYAGMQERVRSRMGTMRHLEFQPYSAVELADILEARAQHALRSGAVDRRQCEQLAQHAHGDARRAITSLRLAVENATEQDRREVSGADLDVGIKDAGGEISDSRRERLTGHLEVVCEVIEDHGPLEAGDIYERYSERVDDPVTRRTVWNYRQKLKDYDLVYETADGREYGRYGRQPIDADQTCH